MSLITLLISIPLTAIVLSLPGFAPYVHAFVGYILNSLNPSDYGLTLIFPSSIAKYPAYAYLGWQYAPSMFRHLALVDVITARVAWLSQVWQSGRRLLSPSSLLVAALSLLFWVLQNLITRAGLFGPIVTVSHVLADFRHKFVKLVFSVRSNVRAHFHRHLVRPCSLFASSFWPCALSHVLACVVTSGFDVAVPASIWPIYPLSFFVGLVGLAVMRRCALKTVLLGALGVDIVAYAYISAISGLARMALSLKLGDWVVLALILKYVFDINDTSCHALVPVAKYTIIAFVLRGDILAQRLLELCFFLRRAVRQCAFQLVRLIKHMCIALVRLSVRLVISGLHLALSQAGRIIFKHMLVHVVRHLVIILLYWICIACVMGCVLAATIIIELFAAMVVPLHHLYSLVQLHYKPKYVAIVIECPASSFEPSSLPSGPSETCLSTLPASPSRSRSATSDGVGRLAHLINAYLDESVSGESVMELENRFRNARSMHAPPTVQTTPPTIPLLSAPTTPASGSPVPPPVLPIESALTSALTPDLTFESGDEDEEVASLSMRLSDFHIELESGSAPRESKCVSPRAEIVFEVYSPSPRPGPVISVQERRTSLGLQLSGAGSLYLETEGGRGVL
ncbi:hypothetical protein RhiJN_08480 [Ceratobasidium sp. AG-Ba]|nr:hypothetical protein RhiJN_08480 [Ceratobasidium sp. AG-Ba]QRW09264.1 hypothetical protein RhiLY_08263 [Ceratobasidium sp. AG-Ba]